jgi:hypothetical protein
MIFAEIYSHINNLKSKHLLNKVLTYEDKNKQAFDLSDIHSVPLSHYKAVFLDIPFENRE